MTEIAARPRTLNDALDSLDVALVRYPSVIASREAEIDKIRWRKFGSQRRKDIELARAWRGLNSDSSVHYYSEALELPRINGDSVTQSLLLIEYARQLGSTAHFQEALVCLDSVDVEAVNLKEKMNYHDVRSRVLLDAMETSASPRSKARLRKSARRELDALHVLVAKYAGAEQLTRAVILALDGDTLMAAGELSQAIDTIAPNSPAYAVACGLLASYYRQRPEKRYDYLYYLALSAASDANLGNKEAYSLELLGSEIFKEGDFERALNYISVAGEAMQDVGVRKRNSHEASPMSIMLQTMRERDHKRHIAFIVTLSLLVIVLVVFMITVARILRRDRANMKYLGELSRQCESKDKYIGQLFDLCASYIDSIEDFNRLVGRKIKANQTKDLYDTVESGKILKQQSERFYAAFDHAVLNIFPDFVQKVNSLFAPDKRIDMPEGGGLTPELRIAAFMRLGVNDSARIAKFLGLSLNTVYTYRNRMKSRANDRDKFDEDLLKIS